MQRRRSMKRFHATTDERGVSAATLGELWLGRLQARDPEAATRRLSAYQLAQRFEELTVDDAVSEAWALLVPYVPLKAVAPVQIRSGLQEVAAGRRPDRQSRRSGLDHLSGAGRFLSPGTELLLHSDCTAGAARPYLPVSRTRGGMGVCVLIPEAGQPIGGASQEMGGMGCLHG